MVLGITLIVLMALLAVAVVVVIIGYSAQVVQRYKAMKNQPKTPPDAKPGTAGTNDNPPPASNDSHLK